MDETTRSKKLELKRKAVAYYEENEVPKQLEGLLNQMFLDQPKDLYGYMSGYFGHHSKTPIINKIETWRSFNSSGHETLTASVWCCIKGEIKAVCDLQSFVHHQPILQSVTTRPVNTNHPATSSKRDSKSKTSKKDVPLDESRNSTKSGATGSTSNFNFQKYQHYLKNVFLSEMCNVEVYHQDAIDQSLSQLTAKIFEEFHAGVISDDGAIKPEETVDEDVGAIKPEETVDEDVGAIKPEETVDEAVGETTNKTSQPNIVEHKESFHGEVKMAALFTSSLCAVTSAKIKEKPLYENLVESCSSQTVKNRKYSIPLPALPVLTCDPSSPGKLNLFKEILIVPKIHEEFFECCEQLCTFILYLEENLVAKFGLAGSVRNSKGILTPPFDKVEHLFDLLLTTSKTNLDVEFSEKFDLILNIGSCHLYDEDKKRYEVCSGQFKSSEDLIEMYKFWLDQYPIVCVIDGLSKKDDQKALFNELSRYCFVCVDVTQKNSTEVDDTQISSTEVDDTQKSSTEVDDTQKSSTEVETENKVIKPLEDGVCNAVMLCPENVACTISDVSKIAHVIKERHAGMIMMAESWANVFSAPFFVDLAIALDVLFIRASSLSSAGGLTVINRLISARTELERNDMLMKRTPYDFSVNMSSLEDVIEETIVKLS